jgi:putative transport protein
VFFVYSVGLQAGPHFIRTIRRRGWSFIALAFVTLLSAWIASFLLAWGLGIDPAVATGIYAGALTSTPALAASLQAVNDPNISVGYGVAYPFGVIGVIVFVQLVPRILRIDWAQEEARAKKDQRRPVVEAAWFEITNPQIDGRTIQEVEATYLVGVVVSRIYDKYVAMPAHAESHLALGQHVRVVGAESDLKKSELLLGPRSPDFAEPPSAITTMTLLVTEDSVCGQTLAEMQLRDRYGITITRMWRDEFEFVPSGSTTLEFGDEVRVVGDVADCQRVAGLVGHQMERLHETRFLPLGLGLLAGLLIGQIPLPLPGGFTLQLGLAGGPLLAGLFAGHLGRIGHIHFRMPVAARIFMNELGLVLFLAYAGASAGEGFVEVVRSGGTSLLWAAIGVTLTPMIVAFLVVRYVFRWDALNCLGALAGAMTCTPGLGTLTKLTRSSTPSAAYVAVYPFALLIVSLLAPLLGAVLRVVGGE